MNLQHLADWCDQGQVAKVEGRPVYRHTCLNPAAGFWRAWHGSRPLLQSLGVRVEKLKDGSLLAIWDECRGPLFQPVRHVEPVAIEIPGDLTGSLLPWQPAAVETLAASLHRWGGALDASLTGTGKTTACLAAFRAAGINRLAVLCPISVIPNWQEWGERFGLRVRAINYERAIRGIPGLLERNQRNQFTWLGRNYGVAFDEAHRIGGLSTLNSKMAKAAARQGIPAMALSATIGDTPMRLSALGEILRLFGPREFIPWALNHGVERKDNGRFVYVGGNAGMMAIRNRIFAEGRGIRLDPATIPEFPEAQIDSILIETEHVNEINEVLDKMTGIADSAAAGRLSFPQFRKSMHDEWRALERLKLAPCCELIEDAAASGMCGILFVHYREIAQEAARLLNCPLIIGGQPDDERQAIIQGRREDRIQKIVCTSAGNEGISLHDVTGRHPTYSVIMPSGSSRVARQEVGRGWRAGARSKAIIRFAFAAGTREADRARRLAGRLNRLDALTNMDFVPFGAADSAALAEVINQMESSNE